MNTQTNNSFIAKRILQIGFTLCLFLTGTLAYAQDKIPWESLSMEQRQVLQQVEQQWDRLPAERQQRLRRGANRYEQMNRQQRNQAQNQQRRYQSLSPQQRQTIRQRFQRFNNLNQQEQRRLRSVQRRYQNLSDEQQQQLRERFERNGRQPSSTQSAEDRRRIQEVLRQTENAIRTNGNTNRRPQPQSQNQNQAPPQRPDR